MIEALGEWLNLALRWLHIIAGIAWIGSSFYFMWLDARLKAPPEPRDGVSGELWAVHSGGFYQKQKFLVAPPQMPDELHWFKWEAYTTWLSGAALLALIYYVGANLYLIDPQKVAFTPISASAAGVACLVAGWLVYDGLCRSPIGARPLLFGVVWLAILTAAAYGLTRIFANRGAFIHVGALMGTVMVANVFLVIIPNQKKAVAAMLAGARPDPALGERSKQRSVHNNYMTLPVVFVMVSNHYPMITGHWLNWLLLAGLGVAGAVVRHFFNLRNSGRTQPQVLLYGALIFAAVFVVAQIPDPGAGAETGSAGAISYAEVQPIIAAHCLMCHSAHPTHAGITAAPNGVMYDTPEQLHRYAPRIRQRAVVVGDMPLGNETHMTHAERVTLGHWIDEGAPTP